MTAIETIQRAVVGSVAALALASAAFAQPALAQGATDGTYTGQAVLTRANNGSTCKNFPTSITITDGHLTYVHGGNLATITTNVGADGSFNGSALIKGYTRQSYPVTLDGKVSGASIDATVSSQYCAFHLMLRKS